MNGQDTKRWLCGIAVLAVLAIGAVPGSASAAWLGYKNETNAPIAVQTAIEVKVVVNGQVRSQIVRGKAHVLFPGEVAWDNIPTPGARQISIYEPKANNRLVHQDTINVLGQDIFLAVQSEAAPAPPKGQPAQPTRIKLVATKPPVPPGTVPKPAPPPGAAPKLAPLPTKPASPPTPAPKQPPTPSPKQGPSDPAKPANPPAPKENPPSNPKQPPPSNPKQ